MKWLVNLCRRRSQDSVLRRVRVGDVKMKIYDSRFSSAVDCVQRELKADCYGIERIRFAPGDVVVDIGGHVGMFAIYLAKRFPWIQIHAFEPTPQNYRHFQMNLRVNGVSNVAVINKAVTRDGRRLAMLFHRSNTGGATGQLRNMHLADHQEFQAESVTLDEMFAQYRIDRCKLLKIDCEGSEHEVLLHAAGLDRIDYLSGEFHINAHLSAQGYSIEQLLDHCRRFIPADHLCCTTCHMAE